jgi:hypothetical protein
MKQAESKVRYFHTGLILAAVLAVLGACDGVGVTESPEEVQKFDAPEIGYHEGDMVTVKVSVSKNESSNSSRSMDPNGVPFFSNFYEVVFKNGIFYYRGEGNSQLGYVSVSVPIGTGYEVLLLGGINRTLLAADYKDAVEIKVNQANVIDITLTRFPPQWETVTSTNSDFTFGGLSVYAVPDKWYIQAGKGITDFNLTYKIGKLKPLFMAEGGSTLTLVEETINLWPRDQGYSFL